MHINIRKAEVNSSDEKFLYESVCHLEQVNFSFPAFHEILTALLNEEDYTCLIAEINGRAVGFAGLRFMNQLHHCGKVAELTELYVLSEWRNMNIGTALLKHAVNLGKENNCLQLEISANISREQTHAFYLKQGFEITHHRFVKKMNE